MISYLLLKHNREFSVKKTTGTEKVVFFRLP